LARAHTDHAVKVLSTVAANSENDGARVTAAVALLDRGWGKPNQVVTGEDGGDIRVTIRQIIENVGKKPDEPGGSSAP
jgi:predicted SpoU family rRNA methylase